MIVLGGHNKKVSSYSSIHRLLISVCRFRILHEDPVARLYFSKQKVCFLSYHI
jgi:hypothetical protein